MTAPFPESVFQCDDRGEFHALRSAFIDEFARLESVVSVGLKKLGLEVDGRKVCFTQRLDRLSKATPGSHLSKQNAAKLAGLCLECEPLKHLRASLVHGVLETGSRGGERVALFRNVADSVRDDPIYHVLSAADFQNAIASLKAIQRRIAAALNPSSQPRPKPAATAGP